MMVAQVSFQTCMNETGPEEPAPCPRINAPRGRSVEKL